MSNEETPKAKLFGYDIDDRRLPVLLIKLVSAVWLVMWVISLAYSRWFTEQQDSGVAFDAISSLFSGLAFSGIIYTVLLQREDLKKQHLELELTRQELELTRKGMELARGEYEQQNQTLSLQRFENTFFQLLNSFEGTCSEELTEFHNSVVTKMRARQDAPNMISTWVDIYLEIYEGHSIYITKYFNKLTSLLEFIERQQFQPENERFYYSLVHSKLTPREQTVIQLHSRLSYEPNNEFIRGTLKKLTRFSGLTWFSNQNDWLFKNYENPRDKKPWTKEVEVEDSFQNNDAGLEVI